MKNLRSVLFPARLYKDKPRPRVDEGRFWDVAKQELTTKQYIAFRLYMQDESMRSIEIQMGIQEGSAQTLKDTALRKLRTPKIQKRYAIYPQEGEKSDDGSD